MILRIELEFSDQAGVIDAVTIYEPGDAFTRFRFLDTRLNQEISPSVFKDIE